MQPKRHQETSTKLTLVSLHRLLLNPPPEASISSMKTCSSCSVEECSRMTEQKFSRQKKYHSSLSKSHSLSLKLGGKSSDVHAYCSRFQTRRVEHRVLTFF